MRTLIAQTRERLLDGADLLLDFLTLGEYGIEAPAPLEPDPSRCR